MTQENIESNNSEFYQWGQEMERLAQIGVKKEIEQHKAAGQPIFYARQGVLIMELSDGRCFEYRSREDGTLEILREVNMTLQPCDRIL